MELRTIVWTDPTAGQMSGGSLYSGFGPDWKNPHLRFGSNSKATVVIDGDYAYQEQADLTQWSLFYGTADSGPFGSLALTPSSLVGMSFPSTATAGQTKLTYVSFDSGFHGVAEEVDSLSTSGTNGLAEVSQLAYQPDGTPCLAYTYRTSAGVAIRYAYYSSGSWNVETVSDVIGTPSPATAPVNLDLAVDSNGIPAVCWTQRAGTGSSMEVALRGA
jgi:hypothetical protein